MDAITAEKWTNAWQSAYDWRADHWGKMPEEKRRRMMKASERSNIAFDRESKIRNFPGSPEPTPTLGTKPEIAAAE